MKIIAIIPSRMNSRRLPGKALAGIGGLPMVVRVCRAAEESGVFDRIAVATDSSQIAEACRQFGYEALMTSSAHTNPTLRVQEAACSMEADYYVMIGGDEPLLDPEDIRRTVQEGIPALESGKAFLVNAMTRIRTEEEFTDPSNIKIVCRKDGLGLYASRGPVPYRRNPADCPCRKFVSIGIYTAEALRYFSAAPAGVLEQTEEIDLLRFLEHGKPILFLETRRHTLSVDTEADLREARRLSALIQTEEFSHESH